MIELDKEDIEDNSLIDVISTNEKNQEIRMAIKKLSNKHKIPIILYYINGFSIKEISHITKCSQGTVKSRIFYAKKTLKNIMEK